MKKVKLSVVDFCDNIQEYRIVFDIRGTSMAVDLSRDFMPIDLSEEMIDLIPRSIEFGMSDLESREIDIRGERRSIFELGSYREDSASEIDEHHMLSRHTMHEMKIFGTTCGRIPYIIGVYEIEYNNRLEPTVIHRFEHYSIKEDELKVIDCLSDKIFDCSS